MLVSPTEPAAFKSVGQTSPVPEKYGADFLWVSKYWGLCGVQRKEVNDLVASVMDGRLMKEVGQMAQLGLRGLILEGQISWTTDHYLLSNSKWTLAQHNGLLWSLQSSGIWITSSNGIQNTIELLLLWQKWTEKQRHLSLMQRGSPHRDQWGKSGNREWGIHFLQGFEGIGPELAGRIYDYFEGIPMAWTVSYYQLMEVKGMGKERAGKLIGSLKGLMLEEGSKSVEGVG